ncbi:MAG: hypothetical protein Q9184_005481 [Pyrenodesmia sp. 2 TL-2023]
MDGGAALRDAANEAVQAFTQEVEAAEEKDGGMFAWFDLRNDFSNEWHEMMMGRAEGKQRQIRLPRIADRLPFWTKGKKVSIRRVVVMVAKPSDAWAEVAEMKVLSKTTGKASTVGFGAANGVNMEGVTVLMGGKTEEPYPAAEDEFLLMLGNGDREEGLENVTSPATPIPQPAIHPPPLSSPTQPTSPHTTIIQSTTHHHEKDTPENPLPDPCLLMAPDLHAASQLIYIHASSPAPSTSRRENPKTGRAGSRRILKWHLEPAMREGGCGADDEGMD